MVTDPPGARRKTVKKAKKDLGKIRHREKEEAKARSVDLLKASNDPIGT